MRLIDLHTNWLLQYAAETSLFDPITAKEISHRLQRLQGYLTDTAIAFLVAAPSSTENGNHADRWTALDNLITRYEAEFSGRLLIDPPDLALFRSEPDDALTWGILKISGLDTLIRKDSDLAHLGALHRRGVRVFQLVTTPEAPVGVSGNRAEDGGITALSLACLERLAEIAANHPGASRLAIDLAGMSPPATLAVLDWLEADSSRLDRLMPIHTHGLAAQLNTPTTWDAVTKLLTLGGLIAIDPDASAFTSPDQLAETLESLLQIPTSTPPAISLSTNFLSLDQVIPSLDNVERLIRWVTKTFDSRIAQQLVFGNATRFIERMLRAHAASGS